MTALVMVSSSIAICYGLTGSIKRVINNTWQTKDKTSWVDKCVKDAGEASLKHPDLVLEYCNCSFRKIQSDFSKQEYLDISKAPINTPQRELFPGIENCKKSLDEKIRAIEK